MKSITSDVTEGQIKQVIRFVSDASGKATQAALDELVSADEITRDSIQRVIAKGDELTASVSEFVKAKIRELGAAIKGCLKLISAGHEISIEATDGSETLAKAGDVFYWIDSDFRNYGTDVPGKPTQALNVEVHEMAEDGDYRKIFGGFNTELDK